MKLQKRKIVPIVISVCLLLVLSACCSHKWTGATCTAPKSCTKCGYTEGEALGHKWIDATCTNPVVCSVCAETAGEALGHDWKDATCTEAATCRTCNSTNGEALGHKIESWTITQEASCTVAGSKQGICTTCGETAVQDIPLKDHSPSDWVITVEPTETSEGTHEKTCKVCGKTLETEKFSMSAEEIEARYKNNCQKISYKNLERTPDKYEGQNVKFSGYVVQVCSEASSPLYYSTYRVATSGRYNNVVYIYVDNYGSGERILEDDYITFYGEYDGLYSYTTVRGDTLSIPSVDVRYVD